MVIAEEKTLETFLQVYCTCKSFKPNIRKITNNISASDNIFQKIAQIYLSLLVQIYLSLQYLLEHNSSSFYSTIYNTFSSLLPNSFSVVLVNI